MKNIRVLFTEEVWNSQQYLVDKVGIELSWLGAVKNLGTNNNGQREYLVYEIYVLEQECTGTSTEISAKAITKLMSELGPDKCDDLYFWGHSHVNMGVQWSAIDENQISSFLKSGDFVISYVFNKKGEFNYRVDTNVDIYTIKDYKSVETVIQKNTMMDLIGDNLEKIKNSLDFDLDESDIATIIKSFLRKIPKEKQIIDTPLSKERMAFLDEEIKNKIKEKKYPVTTAASKTWNGGRYVETYPKNGGLPETSWYGSNGSSSKDIGDDDWSRWNRFGYADLDGENGDIVGGDLGSRQDRAAQSAKSVLSNKRNRKKQG